jgi:predicted RNA-binding protein YlqC (UPF0109 family)
MKDLIEYIAKSIVTLPDEVRVTEEADDKSRVIVKLEVAAADKGRIIGRQGRVAEAMRTLLRVVGTKEGVRTRLEIL